MKLVCPYCKTGFEEEKAHGQVQQCPQCKRPVSLELLETAALQETPGDQAIRQSVDQSLLAPGTTLDGYEILELVGKGGMGAVYKAKQVRLDRIVAIKVIAPALLHSPEFINRFHQEAKTLADLNHPNIVSVIDKGEFKKDGDSTLYYFVMEYIEGKSLRELMREGKITPPEALKIIPQICDALEYAHLRGVVHRDMKPENILVTSEGRIKITDFGIVKVIHGEKPLQELTMSGVVLGTYDYMAPEQRFNPKLVDQRADIYSLGVILYEMLTGELPVGKFALPSKKISMSVEIDEVVLKALEKDPQYRYQKIDEVKKIIEHIQETQKSLQKKEPQEGGQEKPCSKSGGFLAGLKLVLFWFVIVGPCVGLSCEVVGRLMLMLPSDILWCLKAVTLAGAAIVVSGLFLRPVPLYHRILALIFLSLAYGFGVLLEVGGQYHGYIPFALAPLYGSFLFAYLIWYLPGRVGKIAIAVASALYGLMWAGFFSVIPMDFAVGRNDPSMVPYQYLRLVEGKSPFAARAMLHRGKKAPGSENSFKYFPTDVLSPYLPGINIDPLAEPQTGHPLTQEQKEIFSRANAEWSSKHSPWIDRMGKIITSPAHPKETAMVYPPYLRIFLALDLGILGNRGLFVSKIQDILSEATQYELDHFTPESKELLHWYLLSFFAKDYHKDQTSFLTLTPFDTFVDLGSSSLIGGNILEKVKSLLTGDKTDETLRQTLVQAVETLLDAHAFSCESQNDLEFLSSLPDTKYAPATISEKIYLVLSPCSQKSLEVSQQVWTRAWNSSLMLPLEEQERSSIALYYVLDTSLQFLNGTLSEPPLFFYTSLVDKNLDSNVHRGLIELVLHTLQNPHVIPYIESELETPVPAKFRGNSSLEVAPQESKIPFLLYLKQHSLQEGIGSYKDREDIASISSLLLKVYPGATSCVERQAIFHLITRAAVDLPDLVQTLKRAFLELLKKDKDAIVKQLQVNEKVIHALKDRSLYLSPVPSRDERIQSLERQIQYLERAQKSLKQQQANLEEQEKKAEQAQSIYEWLRILVFDKQALGKDEKPPFDLPFYTPPKDCLRTFWSEALETFLFHKTQQNTSSGGEAPSVERNAWVSEKDREELGRLAKDQKAVSDPDKRLIEDFFKQAPAPATAPH